MKTINWGMVGTGSVTERKSGPALYKARNSALYAVTNRTRAKAEDYAARHGVSIVYDNIDEMLADPQIDAIYIATPPDSHKEYALKCAAAKIPCYIEKPVAMNHTDHLEMIKAFEATGTKAFAAYYRRALPRFLQVRELLQQNAVGDVRYVHVSYCHAPGEAERAGIVWRVQPEISGGGIFMDIAVHQLDILDFLFGEITDVKSIVSNQAGYYKPEDTVNICFSFASGVHGSGDWCFTAGAGRDLIEIVGNKGRIALECFGTEPIILEAAGEVREIEVETPEHIQQPLVQTIVDELNGDRTCPSTLYTSERTAWVCDMVYGKINCRGRAQCLVIRDNKILMVKHKQRDDEWYCSPGGGIENGETPEQAAIRELQEECNVTGKIIKKTAVCVDPFDNDNYFYTFHVDIGDQDPSLGYDPEYDGTSYALSEVKWIALDELSEVDRAFLWAAGLFCIQPFWDEVASWKREISYPGKR